MVRDVSMACGRQVRIETEGKNTELDRTLLEAINVLSPILCETPLITALSSLAPH